MVLILLIFPPILSMSQVLIFDNSDISEVARRLFPLFAAPIYFLTFSSIFSNNGRIKVINNALNYFVITFFIGFFLNIVSKDLITNLFVSRNVYEDFGMRGFNSFFPEQSRIPEQCFFAFYLYFFHRKFLNFKSIFLAIITLLAKSGQSIFMFLTLTPFISIFYFPKKAILKTKIKII